MSPFHKAKESVIEFFLTKLPVEVTSMIINLLTYQFLRRDLH